MAESDDATPPATAFPQASTVTDFAANLAAVQATIDATALHAGRNPGDVRLLAVSKTVPEERLRLAVQAGCHELGENKVQEAKRKSEAMADLDISWAIIGHLQTNKVKDMVPFAAEFHALDRLKLAETLDRRLQAAGRSLDVYVQVNTSGEDSKYGLPPAAALPFLRELRAYPSLTVQGLMTLAMSTTDTERVRGCFRLLRDLRDRARDEDPDLVGPGGLSMGMSGDYPVAIEEGATVVRVGQAIFGARPLPDSYYWPSAAH
ncbi:MAG: YggS family pyridoxal phosphate enzyme [Actinobacteria bacterium 69-20]|nr:YggS family pyridoxal phosphate-dependent enzyme [Actinomycetota bacterium]OJV23143.1 MAG: YggS family pyridoxal phosphate enzyme [Actinobacteria bacterium 69-20]